MSGSSRSPCPTFRLLDAQEEWDEDVPIPLGHALVPAPIRAAVEALWVPDSFLHRISTSNAIEWWLFGPDGELIEAFWLED